jgi:hypothetical protein
METLCSWIREHTPSTSVFLVWKNVGPWVPALTGRRVVLGEEMERAQNNVDERYRLSRIFLGDPSETLAALRRFGVTHVVVLRTDLERFPELRQYVENSTILQPVFSVGRWARVLTVPRGE